MSGSSVKAPSDTDIEIGRQVREARLRAGLTQTKLAAVLGVTFQQLQKYENGTNRVSASRLQQIATTLGMRVEALFGDDRSRHPVRPSVISTAHRLTDKHIDLVQAYERISDPEVSSLLYKLVIQLGKGASPG